MLGRTYDEQVCSLARALEVVGERWTLLIVRDALLGLRRFEEFSSSLGLARNVLTDRLNHLIGAGVLERVRYQRRPDRFEYRLTDRGRGLAVPVLALMQWGDAHLAGPALPHLSRDTGPDTSQVDAGATFAVVHPITAAVRVVVHPSPPPRAARGLR